VLDICAPLPKKQVHNSEAFSAPFDLYAITLFIITKKMLD